MWTIGEGWRKQHRQSERMDGKCSVGSQGKGMDDVARHLGKSNKAGD